MSASQTASCHPYGTTQARAGRAAYDRYWIKVSDIWAMLDPLKKQALFTVIQRAGDKEDPAELAELAWEALPESYRIRIHFELRGGGR